jgi:hypothetical protein
MGKRLDSTLGLGRLAVTILFFVYFGGMVVFTAVDWFFQDKLIEQWGWLPTTEQILLLGTGLISASALGLFLG